MKTSPLIKKSEMLNPRQFGLKKRSFCSNAIFVIKQFIKYANTANKRVNLCALNASKTFDKVIRLVLWWKMAKMNTNPHVIKALMSYYYESTIIVNLDGNISKQIETNVGFKQGSPISPDLWNLYVDEMVDLVEINLDGIIFGEQKIDIIAYANDVTLLFSTELGLQRQVDICSNYGKQYEIKFNPDKSL
jgi:hypothetical protein